jgi:hypothetical protein
MPWAREALVMDYQRDRLSGVHKRSVRAAGRDARQRKMHLTGRPEVVTTTGATSIGWARGVAMAKLSFRRRVAVDDAGQAAGRRAAAAAKWRSRCCAEPWSRWRA